MQLSQLALELKYLQYAVTDGLSSSTSSVSAKVTRQSEQDFLGLLLSTRPCFPGQQCPSPSPFQTASLEEGNKQLCPRLTSASRLYWCE